MVALRALHPDTNFIDFLESHARGEPIKHLCYRVVAAFALVLGGFGPLPAGKPILVTVSCAYFSYAVWGLLDRALTQSIKSGWRLTALYLRILCGLFLALGVLSGIGLVLAISAVLLGPPWIL